MQLGETADVSVGGTVERDDRSTVSRGESSECERRGDGRPGDAIATGVRSRSTAALVAGLVVALSLVDPAAATAGAGDAAAASGSGLGPGGIAAILATTVATVATLRRR